MRSELVSQFLRRARLRKASLETPEQAMVYLVRATRNGLRRENTIDNLLAHYQKRRNVVSVATVSDLGCEGALEPLGNSYATGFKMMLNHNTNPGRRHFSSAHEICHTFFYELVPEVKFAPHEEDQEEERLCNLGAAELLMPSSRVERSLSDNALCLDTLKQLSSEYSVTPTSMFLRLRSLGLWNAEYSEWYRMANGTFVLERMYGAASFPWSWDDVTILSRVWTTQDSYFGDATVAYFDSEKIRRSKQISYEVRRKGDRVVSLWGSKVRPPRKTPALQDSLPFLS